jgi:hypothetical protein
MAWEIRSSSRRPDDALLEKKLRSSMATLTSGICSRPTSALIGFRDIGVVENEVEQHRHDVDRDRVELAKMAAEVGRAEVAQQIRRHADGRHGGRVVCLRLKRSQRFEYEGRRGSQRADPGGRRQSLGGQLALHQLGQHGVHVTVALDAGVRGFAEALMHRAGSETLDRGHGAEIGLRQPALFHATRRDRRVPRTRGGRRRTAETASQAGQHVLADQPAIQFLVQPRQFARNVLLERLQQYQPHLHARIDLFAGGAQRIGHRFGADRIVRIGGVLLAEQTAQALFHAVQVLVAVFPSACG